MLVTKLGVNVLLLMLCRLRFSKSFQSDNYVYYDLNNNALSPVSIYSKLYDHDTKQRDYVPEQSSFPLIALLWLKISRCRGRNWLKAWFPLSQLRPDNDQFRVKTKRLAWKMTAQPYNRFVFVSWSWHLSCNVNQALWKPGLRKPGLRKPGFRLSYPVLSKSFLNSELLLVVKVQFLYVKHQVDY